MDFILNEDVPNIKGERVEYSSYIDRRTVATIEKAKSMHWYKCWYDSGSNHREEKGMIACDRLEKTRLRVIHIRDIKALVDLHEEVGDIIISSQDKYIGFKMTICPDL